MGYYDSYNPDLLKLIPPDAKTVLEIGCGEGALCEAYRRVNPGVEYFGIELDRTACEVAFKRGVFAQLECRDIETYIEEEWINEFDCVILGDVLEHLRDPWKTLNIVTHWVGHSAQVLACIPNVQHWTVIRDLINGNWDYTDSGLLDRTHLRFFALKSIREMFGEAGLQVHEIIGRDLFNDEIDEWYRNEFEVKAGAPREMRAYQYLVRARKPDEIKPFEVAAIEPIEKTVARIVKAQIKPLHIHAIEAEDCCARPRIREPFAMLRTIPGVKCGVNYMIPHDTDIVILQRPRPPLIETMAIVQAHWKDKIIIAEIDDLPDEIGIPACLLKAFHAVQVSTEPLAEYCRKQNPNVMVFENQIAELPPLSQRQERSDSVVRIFYGAQNRQADWQVIMPALNRVIGEHGQFLEFVVVHDKEFATALEMTCDFRPFLEYGKYRAVLGSCDIALLPLEDTPFNRCKSDIKFLECAAEGVAVVGSLDALQHLDFEIRCIYCDPESFEMGLRFLIDDAEERRKYATDAYAYVRDNRLLSQHFRKRYDWYQSLLSSKPTLDRQLLERVPELSGHLAPA